MSTNKIKFRRYYLGSEGTLNIQKHVNDIEDRITELEDRVFKKERKIVTTRAQQMLLMYHLGLLDRFDDFEISNKKKALILSVLLNASQDNIEGDLSHIRKKKSAIKTAENYALLKKVFHSAGLKKGALEIEQLLDELEKNEDSK